MTVKCNFRNNAGKSAYGPVYQCSGGGGSSIYADAEYVIYWDADTSRHNYMYVDIAGGTTSLQGQINHTTESINAKGVTSDGTSVFLSSSDWDGSQYITYRYTWNGSSFDKRTSVGLGGNLGNSTGCYYQPANPGYIISACGTTSAGGVCSASYTAGSPWTYGTTTFYSEAADNWMTFGDMRIENPGVAELGDYNFSLSNASNSQSVRALLFQNGTISNPGQSRSCSTFPYPSASGWDRDALEIYLTGQNKETIYVMDMATNGKMSIRGETNSTGASNYISGVCGVNGHVVLREPNNLITTRTLSGTTLSSVVDSLDLPGSSSLNGTLRVSPYTNRVYLQANGDLYVLEIGTDGSITQKVHDATYGIYSGAYYAEKIWFIGTSGLTTTAT